MPSDGGEEEIFDVMYAWYLHGFTLDYWSFLLPGGRFNGFDQIELAKKLNLSEPVISSALNGKNEKSFQRIVDLLMREYNFTHEDIYQQSITLTQMIQEGMGRIETRLDEMQEMIRRLDERLK